MKITAHMVVKNEDIWVWYAINSVLEFVEEIIIYDTGSTDDTVKIIKSIDSKKIIFEEKGLQTPEELVKLRQEQLEITKTDWFLILDGDEIWPKLQLEKLINAVSSSPVETVATFNYSRNCLGDIFHYLEYSAGKYEMKGIKGTLNMRLIKKTDDLKVEGVYPLEAYVNKNGPISNQSDKLLFVDCWYLHASFLKRSSTDSKKASGSLGKMKFWEKGLLTQKSELPEAFFINRPEFVPSAINKRGLFYEISSQITGPIINLKRKLNE